jgi:putative transposase
LLDEANFRSWCSRLRLTQAAREAIAAIRSGRPARCVGGGRRNVAGRYPSRKMGVTIQFESHRVELPFIYEAEHDSQVFEYYDQQTKGWPETYIIGRRCIIRRKLVGDPDWFRKSERT